MSKRKQNAIHPLVGTRKEKEEKKKLCTLTGRIIYSKITTFPANHRHTTVGITQQHSPKVLHEDLAILATHKVLTAKSNKCNIGDLNEALKTKLFWRSFNFNQNSLSQLQNLLWSTIYLGCWNDQGSPYEHLLSKNNSDFNSNKHHYPRGSILLPDDFHVLTITPNFFPSGFRHHSQKSLLLLLLFNLKGVQGLLLSLSFKTYLVLTL